ncbi:MAG TPA: DNA primase noncatalytic subunit PriX [Nitrososphaeraceae archaeon]|nr:DNA primase noncatalytic subunit PriX [Nitrososphaeraceae archaeon]
MITSTVEKQDREKKVNDGIDFLLSHFEGRQRLFPRKMSTFASKGKQFTVYNKEQILNACIISNFLDCRINAYPVLEERLFQAPNIIFIDLDLSSDLKKLDKNLEKTLKIIKQKLDGFNPTVLWTGNGYHIYIVLDVRPLELIEELRELSNESSKQFLRFAESTFTNNKKDSQHNPSFKSCLLRIPGTINSKNGLKVKIIQRFDENNIPSPGNQLLREFRLYLADVDIRKSRMIKFNKSAGNHYIESQYKSSASIHYKWIEKLLETPIEDGRKYTLWKILCPYLVNVRKLQYESSYQILDTWLEICNKSRNLDFNPDIEIKVKLSNVKHYNPISIKVLKEDNNNLYLLIKKLIINTT